MLKLPEHIGECSPANYWLEKIDAAFSNHQTPVGVTEALISSMRPIGYFGKTVKRVYRLTRAGSTYSWMLQCLHDKPTFETRINDWEVTTNYLDPDEWVPFSFGSEEAFSRAFLGYMNQSGSSDYPCQRDFNISLTNFVAEMVKRSKKSYASQQWRHSLSARITEHSVGSDGLTLYKEHGGKKFGEVTLADYIKLLPFHRMHYLRGFGPKLYHALRTDIERERIPWPLRSIA